MTTLKELLRNGRIDLPAVEAHLDALGSIERIRQTRQLGRKEQKRLFDAAEGYRELTVDHLVSPGLGPMKEVVHHGKNTLPAFNHFAKVMLRPTPESQELWGYNRNRDLLETAVGPGYYVAYAERPGEVLVDYLRLPDGKLDHWPPILKNSQRLSLFVYYGMQDVLRGVSEHMTIGRARKGGKYMPAWFTLCKE